MDPLNQDKLYTRLFRMWDRERNTSKILKISNNGEFLRELSSLVAFLRKEVINLSKTNPTLQFIFQKTIENIQYMTSDVLNLRAEKLLKFAKENKPVIQNEVFDFEWQYYQQLTPAFKGFSKSTQRIIQDLTPKITYHSSPTSIQSSSSVELDTPNIESSSRTSKNSPERDKTNQNQPISISDQSFSSTSSASSSSPSLSYVTILTLRPIPVFVGGDLKDYGPVAKGEIAMIPKQNAMIFMEENMLRIIKDHSSV
ncbi:MAG: DNA replication complex subunit Gins51 [Promethearchaeota archaeon]